MSLPYLLSPFRDELEPFKRECIRIKPRTVFPDASYYQNYHIDRSTLEIHVSKFLGKPYWPTAMDYPRRASDSQPMTMVAQINFSEVPPLGDFPRFGLLQLFVCAGENDYAGWCRGGNHRIVFHEKIDENHMNDFSFLTPELFEWSPINTEATLAFSKHVEYGGIHDVNFTFSQAHDPNTGKYDHELYDEFLGNFSHEQRSLIDKVLSGRGEKIGGYADFTQRDPRDKQGDILFLQFDGFADSFHGGTGHIFMPSQALRDRDFSKAYLHHDNT
jgi:uncharacterized protein YwqG